MVEEQPAAESATLPPPPAPPADVIYVYDTPEGRLGTWTTATQGVVSQFQLESLPLLRPGELLETVPGVVITQHSGGGKANQYYLRGFNLDHGTDLAITVAGMPVNMPTHGHGQGYADLNFLLPELVNRVQYRKGPYFANIGDFGAAGAVDIDYADTLDHDLLAVGAGSFNQRRLLLATSPSVGAGHILFGLEASYTDGPWEQPEAFQKLNGVLKYSHGSAVSGFSLTAMAYDGHWNSTDQIPQRAINDGTLGRFGAVDATDGGQTRRLSASGEWHRRTARAATEASAYALLYRLNLWSNFTYFLDDPEHGDQFEQADDRRVFGAKVSHTRIARLDPVELEGQAGASARVDDIVSVGLYHTEARTRLSTTREDKVVEASAAAWIQGTARWTTWLRTHLGLRGDVYRFDVDSSIEANSGQRASAIMSPKLGLALGPWARTELYANAGRGFHSNDGRGATLTVDPTTGEAAPSVTPLVPARGAEVGMRTLAVPNLESSVSLWGLDIDSELLFIGDAGTTEASRPSRRVGVEWANNYRPTRWLQLDADLAYSKARFSDDDPAGPFIPGAVEGVASAGATVRGPGGLSLGIRERYFGPRPLVEDGSVRSKPSSLLYAHLAWSPDQTWVAALDVFNLLDAAPADVDYYYTSRLPGEQGAGVADIHTHPAEPRSLRLSVAGRF